MLTPQEISGKEFVKAVFGGYDMSAVDDFLETLTADYSALYKENAILKSKIKVLVEKVEEYRATDDAMRMALLTAQKMSEEITSEAKKKSEEMLKQTDTDVRERLNELKSKFAGEEERLISLKAETSKYIKASQEILRQHAQFLSKLDELSGNMGLPQTDYEPNIFDEEAKQTISDEKAEITEDYYKSAYNITDPEPDPFSELYKAEEPRNEKKEIYEDEPEDDEPTTPRPKFNFNNLKFGKNYTGE